VPNDIADSDFPILNTGSEQGRERFGKIERIDLVQCEVVVLGRVKQVSIGAAAGTEWFESERGDTGMTKMGQEQSGQDRFANASVGAGDEDNSWLLGNSHREAINHG
jgi:hypothetical protein